MHTIVCLTDSDTMYRTFENDLFFRSPSPTDKKVAEQLNLSKYKTER